MNKPVRFVILAFFALFCSASYADTAPGPGTGAEALIKHAGSGDLSGVRELLASGVDPATLLAYLRTLPAPQNQELAVYPAPAERLDAAQKVIAGFTR